MRATQVFVLAAILWGAPGTRPAAAQRLTALLGGGVVLPLGVLENATNTGGHVMAGVTIVPVSLPVGLRLDGAYSRHGLSGGQDGHFRVVQATVSAVYRWPTTDATRLRPYLTVGCGVYNYRIVVEGLPGFLEDDANTDLGLNAGAGLEFVVGTVRLFAEGRYHNVLADGENPEFLPVTAGLRLYGR